MAETVTNLERLLERLDEAARAKERVTVKALMQAVGSRSYGPLLLTAGLILATPLSGIPGVPTLMALFVFIVAVQLLLRRDHFWMPEWILSRSIASSRFRAALKTLQRPARAIDKPLRPRLKKLTYAGGSRVNALVCIMLVLITPPLELMPFAATGIGVALAAFGLALIAHDGLVALVGYVLTALVIMALVFVNGVF